MANNTRQIRRQIKSIKNTAKITRAMEMISAVKMQKTQAQALASRAYSLAALDMIEKLALGIEAQEHIFFAARPVKNIGIIVMSSNRGLCGSLNGSILKTVLNYEKEALSANPNAAANYITMGKKARDGLARLGKNIIADFLKPDVALNSLPAISLVDLAVSEFSKNKLDKIVMIFPEAISALAQKPAVKKLLPLSLEKMAENPVSYIFEPSRKQILDQAVNRVLEIEIYQALLETNASEHAARMVAMKNATDNAKDLIDDLSLFYNRTRQAAITQEVSEITAGRLALGN